MNLSLRGTIPIRLPVQEQESASLPLAHHRAERTKKVVLNAMSNFVLEQSILRRVTQMGFCSSISFTGRPLRVQ